MTWRYGYTWTLFFAASAILALAIQPLWPQRIVLFLVMTVPITAWAMRRMRTRS